MVRSGHGRDLGHGASSTTRHPEERLTTAPTAVTAPTDAAGAAHRMPTLVILVAIAVVVAALGSLTGARVALGADPAGAGPPLPSSTRIVSNAPPPTPPPGPTVLGATVTFYGRGYGHGVGMSQYGARGRALAGAGRGGDPRPLLPRHDARDGRPDEHHPGPRAARLEGDRDPRR